MNYYINPALGFQNQINFIQNLQAIPYQANNNAVKTINGLSKIVDNFNITLYPDLIDLLISSRAFIGNVLDNRITRAYKVEPTIQINNDNVDTDALSILQQNIKLVLSRPFHIKHPFGRNTPLQAILEVIKLSERHGGSMMMMCYDDEGLDNSYGNQNLSTIFDPDKIDTKRKLLFYPISLASGNRAGTQEFLNDLQAGKLTSEQLYNVSSYSISTEPTVDLTLFNNGKQYQVHTSRLIPIYSGIKANRMQQVEGWDMSALQGCLKAIINYYIFLDTVPEMAREKIHNNIAIGGLEYRNMNATEFEDLKTMIKAFAEQTGTNNYNFLPDGTTVHRDNLRLDDLESVQRMLERQIVMETDALSIDITGEGASGFSNGEDVQSNAHEKLAKIHMKYDWVFEYCLARLTVNTQSDIIKDLTTKDIDVIFDLSPAKTAEDSIKEQQQIIENVRSLMEAGIMSREDAIKNLTTNPSINLLFDSQNFFE